MYLFSFYYKKNAIIIIIIIIGVSLFIFYFIFFLTENIEKDNIDPRYKRLVCIFIWVESAILATEIIS